MTYGVTVGITDQVTRWASVRAGYASITRTSRGRATDVTRNVVTYRRSIWGLVPGSTTLGDGRDQAADAWGEGADDAEPAYGKAGACGERRSSRFSAVAIDRSGGRAVAGPAAARLGRDACLHARSQASWPQDVVQVLVWEERGHQQDCPGAAGRDDLSAAPDRREGCRTDDARAGATCSRRSRPSTSPTRKCSVIGERGPQLPGLGDR